MRLAVLCLFISWMAAAQNVVVYCPFDVATTSACTPTSAVVSAPLAVSTGSKFGAGALRLCHSSTCGGGASANITVNVSSLFPGSTGTLGFWVKNNDATLAQHSLNGPQLLRNSVSTSPNVVLTMLDALPGLTVTPGNPTVFGTTTSAGTTLEPHELVNGDQIYFNSTPVGYTSLVSGGSACGVTGTTCWTVTSIDASHFSIPFDSTGLSGTAVFNTGNSHEGHSLSKFQFVLTFTGVGTSLETEVMTQRTAMAAGTWHYLTFTWLGTLFRAYVDGSPSLHYSGDTFQTGSSIVLRSPWQTLRNANSSLPAVSHGSNIFGSNNPADVSVDDLIGLDWRMTDAEVAALYALGSSASGLTMSGGNTHGLTLGDVRWSAETGKVFFEVDSGADNRTAIKSWQVEVQKDGSTIASMQVAPENNGQHHDWLTLTSIMSSGTYTLTARAYSAAGLIGTAVCTAPDLCSLTYTQDAWVPDTDGVIATTPAPWTDVAVNTADPALDLSVWNRTVKLSGGYGLPQQMTSGDTSTGSVVSLLSSPMTLTAVQAGVTLTLKNLGVALTSVTGRQISWRGRARSTNAAGGNQIDFVVDGSLMFDGYALLMITAQPAVAGTTVALDTVALSTTVSPADSRYIMLHGDTTGTFVDTPNYLMPLDGRSTGFTLHETDASSSFSSGVQQWEINSDDVMLFGAHPKGFAGYAISGPRGTTSFQTWTKNSDASMGYTENFVNYANGTPFVLARATQWQLSFIAGPTRPKFANERAWTATLGAGGTLASLGGTGINYTQLPIISWTPFGRLLPNDPLGWVTANGRTKAGRLNYPFMNAHIPIAALELPFISGKQSVFPGACDDAGQEDNYNSSASWCWNSVRAHAISLMVNSAKNVQGQSSFIGGEYVDETYALKVSNHPLNNTGKAADSFAIQYSYNDAAQRTMLERIYNIMAAAGNSPGLWYHMTAYERPDFSFIPVIFTAEKSDPNPIGASQFNGTDTWDKLGLLVNPQSETRLPGSQSEFTDGGLWFREDSSKHTGNRVTSFRMVNSGNYFWEYQRIAQCALALSDDQQNDEGADWWKIRADFFGAGGFTTSDVFHPHWEQTEVTSSDTSIPISYYTRPSNNTSLLYVVNPNRADITTTVTINPAAMGLTGSTISAQQAVMEMHCVRTPVTGTATVSGTTVTAVTGSFAPLNPVTINGATAVTLTSPIYPSLSLDGGILGNNTIASITDATHLTLSTSIIGTNNVTVATLPKQLGTPVVFNGTTVTASVAAAAGSNNTGMTITGYTVLGTETGGFLNVTGGAGCIAGNYLITSASAAANTWTTDRPITYTGCTGLTGSTNAAGIVRWVKDATSSSDCTVGGSNHVIACGWNGTAWAAVTTVPFSVFGCPGAGTVPTAYQFAAIPLVSNAMSLTVPYRECSAIQITATP